MIILKRVPLLPHVIRWFIRVVYSFEIYPNIKLGKNVMFIHRGLGCVFHPAVIIEDDVTIFQNVKLGANGKDKALNGTPKNRRGVTIYAGACVLGPVTIGKNAVVGANAVVLEDVPDNCVAVGVPARIISKRTVG